MGNDGGSSITALTLDMSAAGRANFNAGASFQDHVNFGDNDKAVFGAGDDLQIYHSGTHSRIVDSGTGSLLLQGTDLQLQNSAGTKVYLSATDGGAVSLRHNDATKMTTTTNGITVSGNVAADSLSLNDGDTAYFGTSNDLQMYHDGVNSYLRDTGTGNLNISGDEVRIINAANSELKALFTTNGAVELYHDNVSKFATTTSGINVTGTAVTDGVTVDGTLDIEEVRELVTVTASTSGTINFNLQNQGIVFANANQLANRTVNLQNPNTLLGAGQSVTCTLLFTNGSSAYYINTVQIDGSTVTPKWSGGSAPTEGNASGIDVYTFTIIKTANATFTVLASQSQYA